MLSFLQVELDPAGGSSYIDMGTQQMMSVPYALYAGSLKLTVSATGDTLYSGGGNYVIIPGISVASCTVSAGVITGSNSLFAGSTITLSNTATGGIWSSSNASVATVSSSTGVVTGVASGTVTISYTVVRSCSTAVATKTLTVNALSVGMSYGGGIVAYIYAPGDPGYVAGEIHGIIAAPNDQSTAVQWGCNGTTTGASATGLGTGYLNTATEVSVCGAGWAAQLCQSYNGGGFTDWYLPSLDELRKLYYYSGVIGGFAISYTYSYYYSSSEASAYYAYSVDFGSYPESDPIIPKYIVAHIRAIRSF